MKQANKNIKKLINAVKKNKGHALNVGIEIGKTNPKIDFYCDKCQRLISHYQHRRGKGLCKNCIRAIN